MVVKKRTELTNFEKMCFWFTVGIFLGEVLAICIFSVAL